MTTSPTDLSSGEALHEVTLTVNGVPHRLRVPARRLLSDALRHDLRLTGTHVGCEHGVCGACTVLVDGRPARSCLMLAVQADGAVVGTIEGLSDSGVIADLQEVFLTRNALQCGFCTPGVLVTAAELLAADPAPSREAIRAALSGNLCRCTGYHAIVDAIATVAARRVSLKEAAE